jgi:diguanylate cyclase (GGDEF)-like protein/PAS domain S-box-containing protein
MSFARDLPVAMSSRLRDRGPGLAFLDAPSLARLVRAGSDAVVLLGADLRVLALDGEPPVDAGTDAPWPTAWGASADDVARICREASDDRRPVRVEAPDGRIHELAAVPLPAADPDGRGLAVLCRDVTDAAQREAQLTADRQRYRALIAATTSVVWRAAPDGRIVETWGWQEMSDQSEPEPLGSGWLDALHPDDRGRVAAHWGAAVAAGHLEPVDYRVRQHDGSYHWARARAVPLRDGDGRVVEWVGTVSDIQQRRQAEQSLREREELLSLAVGATGLGIWEVDLATRETRWSAELKAIAGLPADQPVDDDLFYGMVDPEDRARVEGKITAAVAGLDETPWEITYRLTPLGADETRWVTEWGRLVLDVEGRPVRVVGAIADITPRMQREIDRATNEQRWRHALIAGRMLAWEQNLGTGEIRRSENAAEMLGESLETIEAFMSRVHPADRRRLVAAARQTAQGRSGVARFRFRHPDKGELWFESSSMVIRSEGKPDRIVGVTSDITDKVNAEARLRWAATHDTLTGLFNRDALQGELRRLIRRARKAGSALSLLLVDLDHFKDVNDTLGHDAGDALLRHTAGCLRAVLGRTAPIARLGGDEFAAVLSGDDLGRLDDVTDDIAAALAVPFSHRGKAVEVRASIGVALYPRHDRDAAGLLKSADLALYAAKGGGRGRVALFTEDLRRAVVERTALARDVAAAIRAGRIVPFYQPKVDLRTSAIVGFEALARWIHPDRGVLAPAAFASAFEDPDLALAIERVMLDAVTRDVRAWHDAGIDCGRVAVNLSAFAFRVPGTAGRFRDALAAARLPPRCLEVEVTESVLLDGRADLVDDTLRELHDLGLKISLDDFGTGFASLTHLKRFPVDEIKIDRSFIRDLEDDADDAAIVAAVIGLGRDLGLTVVAEGVETPGQARILSAWGCEYGQGWLYAKPMAASRVPHLLRTGVGGPAEDRTARLG